LKVYLRTIRYGIETAFSYHGSGVEYQASNSVLLVHGPVMESGQGMLTVVTITAGDEFTVEHCSSDCADHSNDKENKMDLYL
jgi:hypothetical protein